MKAGEEKDIPKPVIDDGNIQEETKNVYTSTTGMYWSRNVWRHMSSTGLTLYSGS